VKQVLRLNENKDFSYAEAQKDFGFSPLSFEEGIRIESGLAYFFKIFPIDKNNYGAFVFGGARLKRVPPLVSLIYGRLIFSI